jgi:hypothetical protein
LSHHLELAVTTAARDRLLEQEQRGHAEDDFSVIARKYFPEMAAPAVEQDLELFEKPPPIEPAATISSMGEVAAAVQNVDLAPPPAEPAPEPQPAAMEQLFSSESPVESNMPAPLQSETPAANVASSETEAKPETGEAAGTQSGIDMLTRLLRGESAHPDKS